MTVLPVRDANVRVCPSWSVSGSWLTDAGMARFCTTPLEAGGGPGGPDEAESEEQEVSAAATVTAQAATIASRFWLFRSFINVPLLTFYSS